jgi:putative transposase
LRAPCESFLHKLKREEIYANRYRDLGHLHSKIEAFIKQYYNRTRLHSALGYRPTEEFEHVVAPVNPSGAATIQFFQPAEGADVEGMKRARKNNRPTRVC